MDLVSERFMVRLLHNVTQPPFWVANSTRSACMLCDEKFTATKRRHHCRHCGRVCCSTCSGDTIAARFFPRAFHSAKLPNPARVCR